MGWKHLLKRHITHSSILSENSRQRSLARQFSVSQRVGRTPSSQHNTQHSNILGFHGHLGSPVPSSHSVSTQGPGKPKSYFQVGDTRRYGFVLNTWTVVLRRSGLLSISHVYGHLLVTLGPGRLGIRAAARRLEGVQVKSPATGMTKATFR